jgi:hypothetical protein
MMLNFTVRIFFIVHAILHFLQYLKMLRCFSREIQHLFNLLLCHTFNLDSASGHRLSEQVDGLAGVQAGVRGSDVIDLQSHVAKIQGCLQS